MTESSTESSPGLKPVDRHDRRLALGATGLLRTFNDAGVLEAADVHVAHRLTGLAGEQSQDVLLATALTVRAVRQGSICLDPRTIANLPLEEEVELPWPEPEAWLTAIAASPLVEAQILRLDQDLLYLDRYWREEVQVCDDLLQRLDRTPPEVDEPVLEAGLVRVFPRDGYEEQRTAARAAAHRWTTVVTGGPGTGKTTTVAGVLALVAEQLELETGERPRIALAAPTGKAAARLQSAVQEAIAGFDPADVERLGAVRAVTVHSLLGSRMPRTSVRFRHDRNHRLPYDIVVVDEGSMLALSLAARLLEALRPQTRLVLVGDADQLSSVDAGAVLADLVAGFADRPDSPVTRLVTTHRYGAGIDALAQALRDADADTVVDVLASGGDDVVWIDPDDVDAMAALRADLHRRAAGLLSAARRGSPGEAVRALDDHRLLCAHREGPYGVAGWNREIERLLAEGGETYVYQEWYAGRPVLVSSNDRLLGLNNGDMGITVFAQGGDGVSRLRVVLPGPDGLQSFPTTRMPAVQTVYAMTIHKSQGSQADTVSVILPPEDSPLLTRELFYTAITRAQQTVRVVGSEAAVRAAVGREVQRATGLRARLSSQRAAATSAQ
jgi:exodeoxyribonuclease V alpha subunit